MSIENEHRDDSRVDALRLALQSEGPLPLGMRSRWEAGVAAAGRRQAVPSRTFLSVAAVCAFIGGNALVGLEQSSGALVLILTLGSVSYAAGLRALTAVGSESAYEGRRRAVQLGESDQ